MLKKLGFITLLLVVGIVGKAIADNSGPREDPCVIVK
jgi:hypothetical protein